ncbi:unnamed protein product [Pseudo-nitzschia multistriata]|uniref:Fcf2 pre-rRNA processing C-terminal domain-containing protein n=1 Tax=Pseudo-nitzschia multistriata TaxID=183589 RepID=A0A448YXG6_9STRA|nr:unnamed protein product [Pseudo-nitzschia multistriata]
MAVRTRRSRGGKNEEELEAIPQKAKPDQTSSVPVEEGDQENDEAEEEARNTDSSDAGEDNGNDDDDADNDSDNDDGENTNDSDSDHDGSGTGTRGAIPSTPAAPGQRAGTPGGNGPAKQKKNALTHLVPGYTARMKLDSSSLDRYRCGIGELGRRAEKGDASTRGFVREATASKAGSAMSSRRGGFLPSSYEASYSHFKKGTRAAPDTSAGRGWFGMKPAAMTEELRTDLAIIRNRTYLDPKRFYKSSDKHHSVVQVGTVVEGASEFYSSRLAKKDRRANLTEELMADAATASYAKDRFRKMAREKAYQAELRKTRPKKKSRKFY